MAALGPYLKEIGGLVMGRVSYEQMRGFGPGPFDDIPTVVLTTNSKLQVGASAQVCLEGPQGAIDAIEKRIDGDIWLFGGGKTAACFLDEGLIELTVVPVVLGTGLPLFPGVRDPVTFELVSSRVGELGTVSMVYARRSDR
ncbi:MAG: dihydrofolate reductase family protein [Planctomycetota bacterium]|nr:dihydrofolate reductase family protein [Planctomycetota bacterium]